MFNPLDPLEETPRRDEPLPRSWEVISAGISLATLALGLLLGGSALLSPSVAKAVYNISPLVGVGLYSLLFAALSLLSFRMHLGIFIGFQHLTVIAAYLTLGPLGATATSFIGA